MMANPCGGDANASLPALPKSPRWTYRVWKGDVGRSVAIFNYIEPPIIKCSHVLLPDGSGSGSCVSGFSGPGHMAFAVGRRYIVAAHALSLFEREQFSLHRSYEGFGLGPCGN